jgi:predicted signal transduction protein with EAL and GGDEF domain
MGEASHFEEPRAVVPHAGICAGAVGQLAVLPRCLVRLASESSRAQSMLATIQRTARDLGITTMAKQVEDDATLERLVELGIDWGAGYLFGRPSDPT